MQNCFKRKLTRKESLRLKNMMTMMAIMKANNNYVNKYKIKNNLLREIANNHTRDLYLMFV